MNYPAVNCGVSLRVNSFRTIHPRSRAARYSGSKIKKGQGQVVLAVKDYGIGISNSEQKKIFDQYYRIRNDLRGKSEGLGLGLFICKSIISQHRGKICVESTAHKGSTFFFSLPLKNQ